MTLVAEIEGPSKVAVQERDPLRPGHDEVVVRPDAVGLCATDLELVDGSMVYLRTGQATLPLVPGHEWTGVVEALGVGVVGVQVGDRVIGETSIGCAECVTCASGNYHQCPSRRETGIMGLDGALSTRFVFPARALHALPSAVEPLDAALAEPLAVALRATQRAGTGPGSDVLVVGGGTIGSLMVMLLDAVGASVAIAEPRQVRRARAEGLGARPHVDGDLYPIVLEATGTASGIRSAHAALAASGTLVLVGLSGLSGVDIDLDRVVVGDQHLVGSLGSPGVWPEVVALLAAGSVHPSTLVTHQFALEDLDTALALMRSGGDEVGKIVVRPNHTPQEVAVHAR